MDKETQKTVAEVLILDPVTLRLSILRNLSTDWFTEIPAIEIKGEMECTSVSWPHVVESSRRMEFNS